MKSILKNSKPALACFLILAVIYSSAFSCADAMQQLTKYAPIGLAAFDGAINIIAPAPDSPAQATKALVDASFADLETIIANYKAGKDTLSSVINAINAVDSNIAKLLADLGVAGPIDEGVGAALLLISTTLSAIEVQLQPASPAVQARAKAAKHVVIIKGQSLQFSGKPGDFVKTYNHIMQIAGHADHKL